MANRSGSSGTSTSGSSGNNMEGNGGRTHDPQSMDRDKAGDRWQDRRQEQRQQNDDKVPASGNSASTGTAGGAGAQRMPGGAQGDTQLSWRGTVLAIEPLSRQEAQTSIGLGGAPGAAAVGGVVPGTGAAMGTVYRVTLRTEDGGTQAVLVEAAPNYRLGDNVMYRNGTIQRE